MKYYILSLLITLSGIASAEKINSKEYRFKLTVPGKMVEVKDTSDALPGNIFFDTSAGIVLIISARESKFRSVNEYLDCKQEKLELQLQTVYNDTSLRLVNCSRSRYYSRKTTVLHFSGTAGIYNSSVIYFIHHRNKDIQISFTYRKEKEKSCLPYIDAVMRTLKLK